MADEIKMNASISVRDTNYSETFNPGTVSIDLADAKGSGENSELRQINPERSDRQKESDHEQAIMQNG